MSYEDLVNLKIQIGFNFALALYGIESNIEKRAILRLGIDTEKE